MYYYNKEDKLKIAGIVEESIVDGPGIRFVVFTQGCPHNCQGCHNPQTHDFDGGKYVDVDEIVQKIDEDPLLKWWRTIYASRNSFVNDKENKQ